MNTNITASLFFRLCWRFCRLVDVVGIWMIRENLKGNKVNLLWRPDAHISRTPYYLILNQVLYHILYTECNRWLWGRGRSYCSWGGWRRRHSMIWIIWLVQRFDKSSSWNVARVLSFFSRYFVVFCTFIWQFRHWYHLFHGRPLCPVQICWSNRINLIQTSHCGGSKLLRIYFVSFVVISHIKWLKYTKKATVKTEDVFTFN